MNPKNIYFFLTMNFLFLFMNLTKNECIFVESFQMK